MKKIHIIRSLLMGLIGFSLLNTAHAKKPLWTFMPDPAHPPHVIIFPLGSLKIQYTVTNQSTKTHTLVMKPIQGITPSGCTAPLGFHQSCTLVLNVSGSALAGNVVGGPVLCEHGNPLQCYRPDANDNLLIQFSQSAPILTPSLSLIVLSTNCQPGSTCTATQNAALTGHPRIITIKNTGSANATNISINPLGLPPGTQITNNLCNGATIPPGGSCTFSIQPGNVASSDSSNNPCTAGTQPLPSIVTVTTAGGLSTQFNVLVLGYGCQYQGGFLYLVNDTTANTGSIGGKVVSLVDQAKPWLPPFANPPGPGSPWDADPACAAPLFLCTLTTGAQDINFGQNLSSVSGSTNPSGGGTNGPGDTFLISSILNGNLGNSNIPPATYAAGVCISYSFGGFSDWYLPAICEIDSVNNTALTLCSLTTQSIVGSLHFLIGSESSPTPSTSCNPPTGTLCLTGNYWSSTETPGAGARLFSWQESFDQTVTVPIGNSKEFHYGVRCVRALT